MAHKTAVLNVVGLTPDLIGENTPFLSRWMSEGTMVPVEPILPAVTCSVQATYLTGELPAGHGIVGNGWYFREMDEIKFWRQSNQLIEAPKIWEQMKQKEKDFTCANLFWWYNMNSTVDYLITPRPIYRADGVKIPDILTKPMTLRDTLQEELGRFPLFKFWGPDTSIRSSRWIANSARMVADRYDPTLSLIYLPHLDYNLQRIGPDHEDISQDLKAIDEVCRELINFYEARETRVVVLSEYGITPVRQPVSLNRILRKQGYVTVRNEEGGEVLIPGSSRAFAVADHQIAHIYIKDPLDVPKVKSIVESVPGVDEVLAEDEKAAVGLDHTRSGELIAIAEPDAWFTYYYWLDDRKAPDFAPTVDIHTKPGYDPAELLIDPEIRFPRLRAGKRLLQKRMGFRYTMDLIPLEGSGVRGSHGRLPRSAGTGPLLATRHRNLVSENQLQATAVHDILLAHLLE